MTKKTKKNIKIKNSKKLGKLPIWNLSDLYGSPNSKNIKSDLDFIHNSTMNFEKIYEGKIAFLKAQALFKAIEKLQVINALFSSKKTTKFITLLNTQPVNPHIFFIY